MSSLKLPFKFSGSINPVLPPDPIDQQIAGGWGDLWSIDGITGGEGGDVLTFNESSTLVRGGDTFTGFEAMWETMRDNLTLPQILIWEGGDVELEPRQYRIDSGNSTTPSTGTAPKNKTILCSAGQLVRGGDLRFIGWQNIILRNMLRKGDFVSDSDCIHISRSIGMWLDHLELDSEAISSNVTNPVISQGFLDGTLDIVTESDFITVSNSILRNSDKTCLIGSSPTAFNDRGKLKITFRNCLWQNNRIRQPNLSFGQVHMYNNVFRYVPKFTRDEGQYRWARIHELGPEAQLYGQRNKYYGHSSFLIDGYWNDENLLSGFVDDENWFDPDPIDPDRFLIGDGQRNAGAGSLRPENVTFNPNTMTGYNYPVPLMTPDEAEVYVDLYAGAKYHEIYPNLI